MPQPLMFCCQQEAAPTHERGPQVFSSAEMPQEIASKIMKIPRMIDNCMGNVHVPAWIVATQSRVDAMYQIAKNAAT